MAKNNIGSFSWLFYEKKNDFIFVSFISLVSLWMSEWLIMRFTGLSAAVGPDQVSSQLVES